MTSRLHELQMKVNTYMKWDKETELLEQQFNKRGLQFTSPFEGLSLMQAYGYLDGKRFYFHLRNGNASLCVGVYNREVELKKIRQQKEKLETIMDYREGLLMPEIPKETDLALFPSVVQLQSRVELHQRSLVEVFSELVDNLEPAKQQVEEANREPITA